MQQKCSPIGVTPLDSTPSAIPGLGCGQVPPAQLLQLLGNGAVSCCLWEEFLCYSGPGAFFPWRMDTRCLAALNHPLCARLSQPLQIWIFSGKYLCYHSGKNNRAFRRLCYFYF